MSESEAMYGVRVRRLAERAAASIRWRWMPGMRIDMGTLLCSKIICVEVSAPTYPAPARPAVWPWAAFVSTRRVSAPIYRDRYGCLTPVPYARPDLTDPATVGCILSLVRECWPMAHTVPVETVRGGSHAGWRVRLGGGVDAWFEGKTEAGALVAALEAAPAVEPWWPDGEGALEDPP